MQRREFLLAGVGLLGTTVAACASADSKSGPSKRSVATPQSSDALFTISLAQWSLHRTLQSGEMDNLDFAARSREDFGIEAVEYVSRFFGDKASDKTYLSEMKNRADGEGVRSVLIMCDGLGNLGSIDASERQKAVENHYEWVEAAKYLGCHSIRVNALVNSEARPYEEQRDLSAAGLRSLTEFADGHEMNVIVENHGSVSSDGAWLAAVIEQVDHPRCGTLPDFGNFCIKRAGGSGSACVDEYDKYKGVAELMPYAKAVSAKSRRFDEDGNEPDIDFERLMRIVLDAGYRGYVGVEYEGDDRPEADGIRATKALLERVREKLQPEYSKT